jgi:serine/threonine protein kinase
VPSSVGRNFGPLGLGQVLALAAGLAEGLEVIHAAGVVHRDLKPSNVLLAPDGPRIIDFGISRAAELPGMTRTGLMTGSPSYMSPEQAEGGVVGPASDVFSFGSVLAFAATGREPFGAGNGPTVLYRVVHGRPDIDAIPEPIRSLVARCLAKDPASRPTAGQVVGELGMMRPPGAAVPVSPVPYQPTVTALRGAAGGMAGFAVPHPGPTHGAWTPSPGPPTLRQRGPRRDRRGSGLAWAGVAVAAVVVAGGVTALAVTRNSVQANQGSRPAGPAPRRSRTKSASPARCPVT